MQAKELFKGAWLETRKLFGFSPFSKSKFSIWLLTWILSQAGNIIYVYIKHGRSDAFTELWLVAWPTVIFFAVFIVLFFWNLWLAPFRSLEERFDLNPIVDKKAMALRDMEILSACLESKIVRSKSSSAIVYVPQDRTYTKLMTRYCTWFPDPKLTTMEISYSYLNDWILNIVRTLDEYDFNEAVKLIKESADKNYWPHFADYTMNPETSKWSPRSKKK